MASTNDPLSPKNSKTMAQRPPSKMPDIVDAKSKQSDTTALFESLHAKRYVAGFMYKIDELGVTGKPLGPPIAGVWAKWWAELWGPYLHLWRIPEDLAAKPYYPQPSVESILTNEASSDEPDYVTGIKNSSAPLTLNIADAVVEMLPYGYSPVPSTTLVTPMPPIPYDNFLALNTAGSNLFHLSLRSSIAANAWAGAFRLASFEASRVNEHHTLKILGTPAMKICWTNFGLKPFATLGNVGKHFKEIHYEGQVKVRLCYGPEFVDYYVVISNRAETPGSGSTKESGSFRKFISAVGKKKNQAEAAAPVEQPVALKRAEIAFFGSRTDAYNNQRPVFRFEHVRHVYEDLTTGVVGKGGVIVKIEGLLVIPDKDKRRSEYKPMTNEPRSMAYPGAGFENVDPISDMAVGVDARPRPQHFHIMLPDDAVEANHWIVATLAAFHLDADLGTREKEIEDGEVGVVGKETAWGLLYLSPDDIAGLAMSPETLGEVKLRFAKVFNDKSGAKRAGYLEGWNDAVGQGTTARNAYERQEIEGKAKGLVEWLTKAKEEAGGGKLKSKKESMVSPIINVTEPTVERKTADVEKKKSKRLSAISATSQVSEKRISRKKTTDSRKSTKSVELKSVVARESLEEEGEEVDENGEKMKKHEEGEDGVEGDEDSDKSDSATGESGEGGSTEESDGDEESSEIDENDEEKSETDSESKPAGPVFVTTDLVLLALPILQPNGIWIWQYQFADKETYQPQPNMEIVAQAPAVPFDKKGTAVAMERDDESDEEDGDDGEESSGDDEDDGSEESSDGEEIAEGGKDSASIRRGSLLVAGAPGVGASSAETEQLIPPKKSKKAAVAADGSDDEGSISEGSGSGTESGESGESEEEDDEEYEVEQPDALRQPLLQQNMMIPGLIPGLLPLQPGFMLPNMMGQTPMPMMQDGMQVAPSERSYDDDDDDDAPVSREKFRLFAENSLLAQLPDKTPDGMLVDKRGSSRPSGPLVRLDADTLEVQERAMTHRQALAAKVAGNKDTSAVVSRQHNHGHHDSGPLIGIPASTKPKISGGLLAEVDRREKEKEMLKKMGQYRPGIGGPSPRPPPPGAPPGMPGMGGYSPYGAPYPYPGGYPYPPPMYGGYPYPAYPYGPYPPPHMQQMPGGMPPNIQQGMSPNMPPNIGPNMPPGMPPQMQYPVSEWGEAYDDPMIVHHANVLREQWLESERMKERQRILERGEVPPPQGPYGPPNMQPQQYLQRPPTDVYGRPHSDSTGSSHKHGGRSNSPERKPKKKSKRRDESGTESESGADDSESDENPTPTKGAKPDGASPLLKGKSKPGKNDESDSSDSSSTDDSSSDDGLAYNRQRLSKVPTPYVKPPNQQQRMSYMPQQYGTGPYGPASNYYPQSYNAPGNMNARPQQVQATPGRELLGERKRPPRMGAAPAVAANNSDEEEDEEVIRQRRQKEREIKEQAVKAAEEEKKRRLRRRGVEVDDGDNK